MLDSEIFSDDCTVYRKDRSVTDPGKRGGGVLLAIKKLGNHADDLSPSHMAKLLSVKLYVLKEKKLL